MYPDVKGGEKKMDKKMFAPVMVALFIAVCLVTNGSAANVSATADESPANVSDTPTIVFARDGLEVTGETMINGTPVRELTITVLNETTLDFDEESKSITIDGGYLVIDECASDKCVAKAYSGTLSGIPSSGATVQVNIGYTYKDCENIYGDYARFNLNVPQGDSDSRKIYDEPGPDNSASGTLSASFYAYPGDTYSFTISCVRDDCCSASDTGEIYT